jgi:hypothetical protein
VSAATSRCGEAEELIIRSSLESLEPAEAVQLAAHLTACPPCREEAIETAELVGSLRTANARLGSPSPRFAQRLRGRLVASPPAAAAAPAPAVRSVEPPLVQSEPRPRLAIRRRWLIAALLGSLVGNLALVFSLLGPFAGAPEVSASGKWIGSLDHDKIRLEASLVTSLGRLREEQDPDGLVAGDPVATAWWLLAESRAARILGVAEASVEERIVRARAALLAAPPEPDGLGRAVVALSLEGTGPGATTVARPRPAVVFQVREALSQVDARRAPAAEDLRLEELLREARWPEQPKELQRRLESSRGSARAEAVGAVAAASLVAPGP